MRPYGDDLYLGVAVALVVTGAVVATMFLRRFIRRPRVGGAAVAAMVLLVLALEPRRATDIASPHTVDAVDVRAERPLRPSPPALVPAPPAMRRVPIPSTIPAPPAPLVRRAQPHSSDQPPAPPPAPPLPPASTTTSVRPVVVLPPVPTTVIVTTTTMGGG